jgi:hypothetical protein
MDCPPNDLASGDRAKPAVVRAADHALGELTPGQVWTQAKSLGVAIFPGQSGTRIRVPAEHRGPWAFEEIRISDPPSWLAEGQVRLPMQRARDVPVAGDCLAVFASDGSPAITRHDRETSFAFDPLRSLRCILTEAYRQPRRPLIGRLPAMVHWLPGTVRLWLHGKLLRPAAVPKDGFPNWPQEPAAEALGWLLGVALRTEGHPPRPWALAWPDGKAFAVVVMHDLDTAASYRSVRAVAQLESAYGIRSCYNVVARGYRHDKRLLFELLDRGHEIGVHGDLHDTRLPFLREPAMRKRLDSCLPFIREFQVQGFRSPALLSSPRLDAVLRDYFTWSSSTIDTDLPVASRFGRGVATVFPLRRQGLIEIPQTLPLDDRALLLTSQGLPFVESTLAKVNYVRAVGGVAVLGNHLEPHLTGGRRLLASYEKLLEVLAGQRDAWTALPRQLVTFVNQDIDGASSQNEMTPRLAS